MSQHHQDESLVDAWLDIVGAYKTVHALLNQELTKSGFTFSQYRVIRSLGKYGDMPMNRLGEHMLVTPANITGIIGRLEQKGYVERKETGEDRRICTMRLTRKGQISYQQTSAHHKRIISQIMRTFTKQEIMRLTKLLQRIKEMALKERIRLRNEGTQ